MSLGHVRLVEVSPRDGLQNEATILTIDQRVAYIDLLSECGFDHIEIGSFVSPQWVPQMAHTGDVYERIYKKPGVRYSALVPNLRGLQDALGVGVDSVAVFTAASETFNQKNINCSIDESFERFKPMMQLAQQQNIYVRGYVSTVVECPFEGAVNPLKVAEVAQRLADLGCDEISLGDTTGIGTHETMAAMLAAVLKILPANQLAIHCHDTYGRALDNIQQALEAGIRVVDAAVSGVGGCPYAKVESGQRAPGNVATELVLGRLRNLNGAPVIDDGALQNAQIFIQNALGLKTS